VQCDQCDFNLFLLSVPASFPNQQAPSPQNMCIDRCEDYAYNYVSNTNTMQCEYCGPSCELCSVQYGCQQNAKFDRGFRLADSADYHTSVFPFTDSGPPSTLFKTP